MKPSQIAPAILVVDDSPTMREMIAVALESVGFAVVQAEDGFRALDALEKNELDLVVTDINMPEMDGLALVKAIRADRRRSGLAIIALSAQAGAFRHRIRTAGADAVIAKPFDRIELVQAIERLLTRA